MKNQETLQTVTRHAVTFVHEGSRWLVKNGWRNKTHKEGENLLKAILAENPKDKLEDIFGKEPDFKVIPVECSLPNGLPLIMRFDV